MRRDGWKWVGAVVAVVWIAGLSAALMQSGRSHRSENLIITRPNAFVPLPFTLSSVQREGAAISTVKLKPAEGVDVAGARSIGFHLDVSDSKPDNHGVRGRRIPLVEATLKDENGAVLFRARESFIEDEGLLELFRVTVAAAPVQGGAVQPGFLRLEVVSVPGENITLWTRNLVGGALGLLEVIPDRTLEPAGLKPFAQGTMTWDFETPPLRRLDLARHVWGSGPGSWVPWGLILVSGLALGLGIGLLTGWMESLPVPGRQALAAACMVIGFGMAHAWFHPPFAAPDEADHLLSYAEQVEDPVLPAQLLELGRRGHVERIRSRTHEKFSAADMGRPMTNFWDEYINVTPLHMQERSASTCRHWRFTRPVVRGEDTGGVILRLRLLNVLTLAMAVGVAAFWMGVGGVNPTVSPWMLLMATPAVTFFGMQVSNYFLLIGAQIALAGMLACPWRVDSRDVARGICWGTLVGLSLLTSRAALPLVGVAGLLVLTRLGTGGVEGGRHWKGTLLFWGSAWVASAGISLLSLPEYDQAGRANWQAFLPSRVKGTLGGIPLWLGLAVVAAGVGLMEAAVHGLRRRTATVATHPEPSRVSRGIATGIIGCLGLLWLMPLVIRPAGLSSVSAYGGVRDYLVAMFRAMAMGFGAVRRDFLVAESFWRVCGYNEIVFSSGFAAVLCLLVLIGWGVRLGLARDSRPELRHALLFLVATVLYLTGIGVGAWQVGFGVYGRYLVGFYVFVLIGAGIGLSQLFERWGKNRSGIRAMILLPVLMQGAYLWELAGRYY